MKNKIEFSVMVDGVERKLAAIRPNYRVRQCGDLVRSKAFREAVEGGAPLRANLDNYARAQNVWNDDKEKEFQETRNRFLDNEKRLAASKMPLKQAREIALQMRADRAKLSLLRTHYNELDGYAAESIAENRQFNYLLAASVVDAETGAPHYKDLDDLLSRDGDPAIRPAGDALTKLIYGLDDDFHKKLQENKFLVKYKFADPETLRLIDKDGRFIDSQGRLVDKDGRWVDKDGRWVDEEGNPLTESGDLAETVDEFYDDDGKVVAPPVE